MSLSLEYKRTLIATHAACRGWGNGGKYAHKPALEFASQIGARSILDYGCGQGFLKKGIPDTIEVREYDPGIIGKDAPPEPADLVVCTDVLEHVEPEHVVTTLADLRHLALRGLYAVISCGAANLILTDGRNAHLTIQPPEWWLDQLRDAGFLVERSEAPKGLHVWAR